MSSSSNTSNSIKICQLCGTALPSLRYLLKHIRQVHAHKPGFQIICQLSGCTKVYRKFEVFRNHVYDFHSEAEAIVPLLPVLSSTEDDEPQDIEYNFDGNDQPSIAPQTSTNDSRKKTAAIWILKIQETFKLPQSSINQIMDDFSGFIQDMLIDMFDDVKSVLSKAGVEPSNIPGLSSLFSEQSVYAAPFKGLETQYLQMKYYKESLGLVEPCPVLLGTEKQWIGSGIKRKYVDVREEMMYIPLLGTLQTLLNDLNVQQQMNSYQGSTDGILRDYCDGSHFKNHPLRQYNSSFLQIFLYYDDLEVCNPIGSKRIKHKLALFYFVLGNLPPALRSKLGQIQLAAIAKSNHVKKYGMDTVLKPIIDDILKLENGYEFTISGKPTVKYGTICVIPADNLASNALGGFKEGSQATRGCRHCTASPEEMKSIFTESKFTLRNPSTHSHECDLLEGATVQRDRDKLSTEFGINRRSILDSLKYFSVCCGGMIQDTMHDILEGLLEYETKELLVQHIDVDKYYSLDELNYQICAIELGYMECRDKPSTISRSTLHSSDHKLKQQASQMWLLGKLLPQLIGSKVPECDDHWQNYLLLLSIVDMLLAPALTEDDVAFLATMIFDHHFEFKRLYPHASIIPKMHYIVHMPRLVLMFGPPRQLSTIRFEAKHSYFKGLTHSIGNFINLPYTLAKRHQKLSCYQNLGSLFSQNQVSLGPEMDSGVLPREVLEQANGASISKVKSLDIAGTLYRPTCAVIVGRNEEFPVFGKILDIYIVGSQKVYFCVQQLITTLFNEHYHCHIVKSSDQEVKIIPYESLLVYTTHHIRILPHTYSTLCIVCKHFITTLS